MLTAIIVGAGHRALTYASYAEVAPDKLKIVGVADPDPFRRQQVAERFCLAADQCYESGEELARKGKLADAVINGTMDLQHVPTSIPLIEAGYDMLLEKPFAVNEKEALQLYHAAKDYKRKIMICHVLRYAPFYFDIKQRLINGDIGEVINIQTAEHVSYHHAASCFVRGKWNREDTGGSSSLMAKCCHDLDLITWMMSGVNPLKVSSFGGRYFFRPENAPEGAGNYCLLDCPIEKECLYSVRKHHLDHPDRWAFYVWTGLERHGETTLGQKEEFLKQKDNPYSRCVWKSDNTVADRQSVMIEMGTSRPMRKIHIIGTKGEMQGIFDDGKFTLRHIDLRPGQEYTEEEIDMNISGDATGAFGSHGGGDMRLTADFVSAVSGDTPSIACTSIEDSLNGHLIGFCADRAMLENKIIAIPQ